MQPIEYNPPLKIKFASIDENGELVGDASQEYTALFPNPSTKLEGGWVATKYEMAEAKNAYLHHRTWILTNDKIRIAAVAHETGMELLIDPVKEIAIGVATAGVTSVITWLWNKWRDSRKDRANKVESSYVIETVSEVLPDGKSRKITRLELRGPVSVKMVGEHTANALAEFSQGKKGQKKLPLHTRLVNKLFRKNSI
jgi:hypothetical protein